LFDRFNGINYYLNIFCIIQFLMPDLLSSPGNKHVHIIIGGSRIGAKLSDEFKRFKYIPRFFHKFPGNSNLQGFPLINYTPR